MKTQYVLTKVPYYYDNPCCPHTEEKYHLSLLRATDNLIHEYIFICAFEKDKFEYADMIVKLLNANMGDSSSG